MDRFLSRQYAAYCFETTVFKFSCQHQEEIKCVAKPVCTKVAVHPNPANSCEICNFQPTSGEFHIIALPTSPWLNVAACGIKKTSN